MLALSTSWINKDHLTGDALIKILEQFDISGIELDYRISSALFRQLIDPLKQSSLQVVSLHNFTPIPSNLPNSQGGGDLFLLSDTRKEERLQAVKWTKKTIQHANNLEAEVVVLHCGRVPIDPQFHILKSYVNENRKSPDEVSAFVRRKLDEIQDHKAPHLDSLMFSLDTLISVADKYQVSIGIENRYYYNELPDFEDIGILLNEFRGGPIGYWHDTGHSHVNEYLSVLEEGTLLSNYSEHLLGFHLHDAIGVDDHLALGSGEIDFKSLLGFITEKQLVIELKPGTTQKQVEDSIRFVQKLAYSDNS